MSNLRAAYIYKHLFPNFILLFEIASIYYLNFIFPPHLFYLHVIYFTG
jgi:hypothetical protein